MTTTYEETPTFEDRIWGAQLIIDGRVEQVVDVRVDYSGDQPQVQTVFRVNVENVLKGQTAEASVNVRVVGGVAEGVETDWSIRMKEGDRVLLMLAQDYGSELARNMFVPYFSTGYPITAKDGVKLDEDTAAEFVRQRIQVEKVTAKLADVRSTINRVIQRQEEQVATLVEMEPAELREMPYGEVGEMPQAEPGGATSTSPEGEIEESTEAE